MKRKNKNSSEESVSIFSIDDLGVSAALLYAGYKLLSIKKDLKNSRKFVFTFEEGERMQDILDGYFSATLDVNAFEFFDCVEKLMNGSISGIYNPKK